MTDRKSAAIRSAVQVCLSYNIPFAVYSLPGSADVRFMAMISDVDGLCRPRPDNRGDAFFIGAFAADEPYTPHIYPDLDEDDVIELGQTMLFALPGSAELPYLVSTPRSAHRQAVRAVASRLRRRGGKVVLSRHKAMFCSRPLEDVALSYIMSAPASFGYLCFTPEHGFWYGATPELLLDATVGPDGRVAEASTMALAGTRWNSAEPWDDKNLSEHAMVADYIESGLSSLGLTVDRGSLSTLSSGCVEHLYTPLKAHVGQASVSPFEIVRALSPTPAVAGLPVDEAITDIDLAESHQRRCYAGNVGIESDGRYRAYVNLRCAKASPALSPSDGGEAGWVHNIYAGGGILAESDDNLEWEELEHKSAPLVSLLNGAIDNPVGCTLLSSFAEADSTCTISTK